MSQFTRLAFTDLQEAVIHKIEGLVNRRHVTIPLGAIQDASFNTKNPSYV